MSKAGGGDAKDKRQPQPGQPDQKLSATSTSATGLLNAPEAQKQTEFLSAEASSQQQNPSLHDIPATGDADSKERQVIAVSASKNPAAFFNLARKFLVTDEFCDLSALEGAIVSAVDAAHLLERSKLATIIRIQTSYVTVEPRKKSSSQPETVINSPPIATSPPPDPNLTQVPPTPSAHYLQQQQQQNPHLPEEDRRPNAHQGKKGNPLRRSRIIITVKRTEDYKAWLDVNDSDGTGDIDADINED